jgi:tyrosine-protein phosphatase OCA1
LLARATQQKQQKQQATMTTSGGSKRHPYNRTFTDGSLASMGSPPSMDHESAAVIHVLGGRGLIPPPLYGLVEDGVHRSGHPAVLHISFLERLKLKTVLYLSPDPPDAWFMEFVKDERLDFVHLRTDESRVSAWAPVGEGTVLDALFVVLDKARHPVLVIDQLGMHRTGLVIGCLRKAQGWALTSIIDEYRRFSGRKSRLQNEQFIELFDVDLVRLPGQLPNWFRLLNV